MGLFCFIAERDLGTDPQLNVHASSGSSVSSRPVFLNPWYVYPSGERVASAKGNPAFDEAF